jgi:hypothetical protein
MLSIVQIINVIQVNQNSFWKNGRMEECKNGRMEEYKNGKMQCVL